MKYQEFIKSILSGKIAPVYFFYGDETYLIEEGVAKIENKYMSRGSTSFDRDVFYSEESDASQIVDIALSVPMMAPKRVVIVKNFQRIPQTGKELILRYCRHPSPQTILILIAENVDFRKKIYSEFQKLSQMVECKELYDNQVPPYIQQFVRGKTIHPRAIQLLQTKSGNSLRGLINETEKLIHFIREKREILPEDVEQLVGISRTFNVFQLWDALGERNLAKSLMILHHMLERGEKPVFLISSLTHYFMRLWRIRALKRRNTPDSTIGQLLHIHRYFLNSSIQQARRYSDSEIQRIMKLLLEADTQVKSSYQKPKVVLELLILQILNQKKAA
ncbi:MAG: DNA polymerase III subunit delta [Candidatus Zixiibacteriota bacterium]